jgi:hypothetical protein
MISAPSEIRCRLIPNASMNTNTIASTSGMLIATTRPARNPRLTRLTISTMPMASNKPRVKCPTDSSTTAGWLATRCTSMPTGRSLSMRCNSFSSAAPRSSTFPPLAIETPTPIAGAPL